MKVGYMATLKVADGKQEDFEAAFAEMQKAVAADEPGTLQYDLMQDEADPTTYRVFEIYESEEARKAHGRSCLLYTSPSPRDVEESRMPSSA